MDNDPFSWIEDCCRISASQVEELNSVRLNPDGGGESELEVETESDEEAVAVEEVVMVSPPESEEEEYGTPPERHSLTSSNEAKMGPEVDGDEDEEVNGTNEEEREKAVDIGGDESDGEAERRYRAKRLKIDDGVEESQKLGEYLILKEEKIEVGVKEIKKLGEDSVERDTGDSERGGVGVAGGSLKDVEDDEIEMEEEDRADGSVKIAVEDTVVDSSGCLGNGDGRKVDDLQCGGKTVGDGIEGISCSGPAVPVLSKASVEFRKLPASFCSSEVCGRVGIDEGSNGLGTSREGGAEMENNIGGGGIGNGKGIGDTGFREGHGGVDAETSQGNNGAKSVDGDSGVGKKALEPSKEEIIQNLWKVLDFLADREKPVYKEKVDIIGAAIKAGITFPRPSWWSADGSDDDSY